MNKKQLLIAFIMGILLGVTFVVGGFSPYYYDQAVVALWVILITGGIFIDKLRTKPR